MKQLTTHIDTANQRQQRLVLAVSILASFVAFLDSSVVTVALPAIAAELHGDLATQQWVVDAYLISLSALMLIAGSLSDIFGRKKIMVIGLLGFAVASILCAVAPNASFLIIARGLQGIAGALLVPSSLALIISTFSGSAQGRAIGAWTAWTGISFIIGPLVGGFLVDVGSWRWIFFINLLPIILTILLIKLLRHKDAPPKTVNVDLTGAILCAFGLGGTVYALIEQSRYGWSSPIIYISLVTGVICLLAFWLQEKRATQPMLPPELFTSRNFSIGNLATASIYGGLAIATFLISVFVQQVGHYSAFQAGMALLPVTIIMFFLSSRVGEFASRLGPRWFMAAGPLVASTGFLYMLRTDSTVQYWSQLFPGIVIFGVGLSLTVAPLTSAILSAVQSRQAGIGSAVNNAVSRIAGLIAIAALSVIVGPHLDVQSFRHGLIATAILLTLGGLESAIGIVNKSKTPADFPRE